MQLEIEQKFPVSDLVQVRQTLEKLGASFEPAVEQADLYFRHPAKDFSKTDEALRLRRVGENNYITYKGPKIDPQTKTRREIESSLEPGSKSFAAWTELLEILGFTRSLEVRKRRTPGHIGWNGQQVELALDQVEDLGSYLELEVVAEESEFEGAKRTILALAEKLGLKTVERRGYLSMLLARSEAQSKA